jgi:hypothetical protein
MSIKKGAGCRRGLGCGGRDRVLYIVEDCNIAVDLELFWLGVWWCGHCCGVICCKYPKLKRTNEPGS